MKPTERERAIAKTLLILYPHLEDYRNMLQQKIMKWVLGSFNSTLPTEQVMEKIIDTNVRRDTIKKLKTEIDLALSRVTPFSKKIIMKYYTQANKQKTLANIAKENGVAERCLFRRIDTAIDELAAQLNTMGINAFTWSHLLIHHTWIKEAFNRNLQPHQSP
jgi:DNA-directed RNA polymerase sigma subunit (sigma70/sigma32)